MLCLAPLAFVGVVAHYATYKLAGLLATKIARADDDVVSTIKIVAAMLFFPLTWIALALLAGWLFGWIGAGVALAIFPLCGWIAVRFFEKLDGFVGGARALRFYLTRRWFFKELLAERRGLREEITALGEEAARDAAAANALVSNEPTRHTI